VVVFCGIGNLERVTTGRGDDPKSARAGGRKVGGGEGEAGIARFRRFTGEKKLYFRQQKTGERKEKPQKKKEQGGGGRGSEGGGRLGNWAVQQGGRKKKERGRCLSKAAKEEGRERGKIDEREA